MMLGFIHYYYGGFKITKWKWCVLVFTVLITLVGFNPAKGAENSRADWSGLYDILITTSNGQQVPAEIDIRTIGSQVEVSSDFKQYPVNLVGDYTGDVEGEGVQAHFDINEFGLVKGQADFIIRRVETQYQIEGQAAVSYFYMTKSGQLTADFTGQRREAAQVPTPAPVQEAQSGEEMGGKYNYATIMAIIIGLIALAIMLSTGHKCRRQ